MSEQPVFDEDAKDLQKLGYLQELLRDMGGFSNFAVSFSTISILTGAVQLYGYGLQHGGPLQMTVGWLVVSVFTTLVSISMAELASSYPTAGALYHWSCFLGGKRLGWFTACFNTLAQFAGLAGIDFGLAIFFVGLCGWTRTPLLTFSIYGVILLSHAFLNHMGIRVVAWLNKFSATYHIVVVGFLLLILSLKGFSQPFHFLFKFHQSDSYAPWYSFVVGLLLAQWTFTGYDASAHVSEETHDPRRNAPWGIFLSVFLSVIFGLVMLVAVTLSISDLPQAAQFGDNAFAEVVKLKLGPALGTFCMALIAGAMWLSGLAAMTSASRMVYAFARDGGLPPSKFWAKVNELHRTPSNAIWGIAVLALGLALSVKLYEAILSVAVIAFYISYGLPIAARLYFRYKHGLDVQGPWNTKRLTVPIAVVSLIWICFICVVFVVPPNEQAGPVVGIFFVVFLLTWTLVVRRRFAGPKFQLEGIKKWEESSSGPKSPALEV